MEDEGFVLVALQFPGFDQGFFFRLDLFQQLASRLIVRVLRNEFTPDGKVKDLLAQQFGVNHGASPFVPPSYPERF